MASHNPDILTCLANLSADEVFTPPKLASAMLDLLPPELFRSPTTTFLDPVCKSGVFLREVARRLNEGLADQMPDDQKRVDHILTKQVFGLAITELTALISRRSVYCSKKADGRFSIATAFTRADGNIRLPKTNHTWNSKTHARTRAGTRAGSVSDGIAPGRVSDESIRAGSVSDGFAPGRVGDESIRAGSVSDGIAPGRVSDESIRTGALKCIYCGAGNWAEYGRNETSETYAYPFIHGIDPTEVFNVKFDVIIGNPPYQLSDGGFGRSASPIYHEFVRQAKKLEPRYLMMVIPSRWFGGGKGLDEFRSEMLSDDRLRKIVDYESSSEVFPGVDVAGGISYFLWDRENRGPCAVTNINGGDRVTTTRKLDEFPIFIRNSRAVPIVKKVITRRENGGRLLSNVVSSRKPFGLPTNYDPKSHGIPCWFIQRIGRKYAAPADVIDDNKLLDKWKLLIPPAPIAGQTDFSKPIRFYYDENTRIAKPGECCTESWLVACAFDTLEQVKSFRSYLFTKTARFLLLQTVISQHVTKSNFVFVPDLGRYEGVYTDEMLVKRWGITPEEWAYIDAKIG